MKYIRTKDGVFDIEKYCLENAVKKCFHGIITGIDGEDIEIIKQAKTIEELCDEFVGIDSQGHYIIHNDEWLDGARILPLEEINYYGAIWTDKGLIYVAKMNEKGELELL